MNYFDTYEKVKRTKRFSSRSYLRHSALSSLAILDKIRGIEQDLGRPRIQFLYIHHVFKDEEVALENLLKALSKKHTFLSYSNALIKIYNQEIDKPYLVISSDDGFKNNLRASEILTRNGISACFFINPSIIGETNEKRITTFCKEKLNFPPIEFLKWNDVERLQKLGHEIGSHTMTHINIARASREIIVRELCESYDIIKQRCGDVKHFAFPYGRFFHFTEAARKIVYEAGFVSCATAERGCHINHNEPIDRDRLCILRDHVILDWPIDHILYLIAKNSRVAQGKNNLFPYLEK